MSAPPNNEANSGPQPTTELGPFSSPGAAMTPWIDTWDGLRRAQKYWLTSVRPDGRPHVTPLLAAWALDGLCFSTGDAERKAKNLEHNQNVVLTTGVNTLNGMDYVVEGAARLVTAERERADVADAFEAAYGWHLAEPDGTWRGMGDQQRSGGVLVFAVRPRVAFAFGNGRVFSQTVYRWN